MSRHCHCLVITFALGLFGGDLNFNFAIVFVSAKDGFVKRRWQRYYLRKTRKMSSLLLVSYGIFSITFTVKCSLVVVEILVDMAPSLCHFCFYSLRYTCTELHGRCGCSQATHDEDTVFVGELKHIYHRICHRFHRVTILAVVHIAITIALPILLFRVRNTMFSMNGEGDAITKKNRKSSR